MHTTHRTRCILSTSVHASLSVFWKTFYLYFYWTGIKVDTTLVKCLWRKNYLIKYKNRKTWKTKTKKEHKNFTNIFIKICLVHLKGFPSWKLPLTVKPYGYNEINGLTKELWHLLEIVIFVVFFNKKKSPWVNLEWFCR